MWIPHRSRILQMTPNHTFIQQYTFIQLNDQVLNHLQYYRYYSHTSIEIETLFLYMMIMMMMRHGNGSEGFARLWLIGSSPKFDRICLYSAKIKIKIFITPTFGT